MSRPEAISYADKHGLDLGGITEAKPYSVDQNLWGRTIEAGVLEDPWLAPPADAFEWTASPARASGTSEAWSASRPACRSRSTGRRSGWPGWSPTSTRPAARPGSGGST